jgi:hypothetical protein
MSYLASSNNVFGARSVKTPLNKPVQYLYIQIADSPSFTNNNGASTRSMFKLDAGGSTNVVDDLFVADQGIATIKIPITGI